MKALEKKIGRMALALSMVLVGSINTFAQNEVTKQNIFLRVYNVEGKKIGKGSLLQMNDSLLVLKNSSTQEYISLKDIGSIRTKRSAGNNVFIGAASGAVLGAAIGVSTADPDDFFVSYSAGEGAAIFGGIAALGGGAIGGITSVFKKSKTFVINADMVKWKIFKEMVENRNLK